MGECRACFDLLHAINLTVHFQSVKTFMAAIILFCFGVGKGFRVTVSGSLDFYDIRG
jgi:hypothetical protein